jgi:hypothetical protein
MTMKARIQVVNVNEDTLRTEVLEFTDLEDAHDYAALYPDQYWFDLQVSETEDDVIELVIAVG